MKTALSAYALLLETMLWAGCTAEAADGVSVATLAASVIGLALVRRLAWKLERRAALDAVLGFAHPSFRIDVSVVVAAMEAMMPGSNFGQCGFLGCAGAAAALVDGSAFLTRCSHGGKAVAAAIAARLRLVFDCSRAGLGYGTGIACYRRLRTWHSSDIEKPCIRGCCRVGGWPDRLERKPAPMPATWRQEEGRAFAPVGD